MGTGEAAGLSGKLRRFPCDEVVGSLVRSVARSGEGVTPAGPLRLSRLCDKRAGRKV